MRRRLGLVFAALAATLLISGSAQASFPGKNGKIAFALDNGFTSPHTSIQTINPDGTGQSTLIATHGVRGNLAWTPDGKTLAYSTGGDIRVVSADGTGDHLLPLNNNAPFAPSWSPDAAKLAYDDEFCSADPSGCEETIFIANADGSGAQQIADDALLPAWSPDGSKIAFLRDSTGILFTMNPDGSGQTPIPGPVRGFYPDWSPNGQKLVFTGISAGNNPDIYTVNLDGTGLTRLTTNAGGDYVPVFSPDATKIAFTNDSNPPSCNYACPIHVYVMNADGTSQVAIAPADVGTQAELPAWQPIPGPKRSDYKNSNQFCKAEQAFWGDQFSQRYRNFGQCVSGR